MLNRQALSLPLGGEQARHAIGIGMGAQNGGDLRQGFSNATREAAN
jgi:hypothetical protein